MSSRLFTRLSWATLLLALVVIVQPATLRAAVTNGGFELGTTGWTILGNGSTQDNTFIPLPATPGNTLVGVVSNGNFPQPNNSVTAATLQTTLGLGATDWANLGQGTPFNGSAIYQTLNAGGGDTLAFTWKFVTAEVMPGAMNDFGFYFLKNNSTNAIVAEGVLGHATDLTLTTSASTLTYVTGLGGARESAYTTTSINVPAGASYTLGFGVTGVSDSFGTSLLAVDNVTQTASPVPLPLAVLLAPLAGGVAAAYARRMRKSA